MFKFKTAASLNELPLTNITIISAGTTITGNVHSNGDIRIDGTIHGNLEAKGKILIGATGIIEGDIVGKQADVLGKINGNIKVADLLHMHGKAFVDGDIFAGKLQIEPSASFNGQCHMGASVVEFKKDLGNVVNE